MSTPKKAYLLFFFSRHYHKIMKLKCKARQYLSIFSCNCVSRMTNYVNFKLTPRLYGEKFSRVEGSPAYPSYLGRANFSYISLQNLANRLYEKQKIGSARRVTRLAGSSFCDGRVTLLAGPTFLHINTLVRSAGTTPRKFKSVLYLKNEHCGLNCCQFNSFQFFICHSSITTV